MRAFNFSLLILKALCRVQSVGSLRLSLLNLTQPWKFLNAPLGSTVSHLRPRFAYVLNHYWHAPSRRRESARRPPRRSPLVCIYKCTLLHACLHRQDTCSDPEPAGGAHDIGQLGSALIKSDSFLGRSLRSGRISDQQGQKKQNNEIPFNRFSVKKRPKRPDPLVLG